MGSFRDGHSGGAFGGVIQRGLFKGSFGGDHEEGVIQRVIQNVIQRRTFNANFVVRGNICLKTIQSEAKLQME